MRPTPEAPAAGSAWSPAERRRVEGLGALLFVQFVFGLFPLFVHYATDPAGGFAPRALAVWRIALAAAVLGALAVLRHPRRLVPARADLPRFLACALFGIVANQVLALEGVSRTSATQAGLLMTLIPVFTFAIAVLARQELFQPRRAAGIAVALAGAVLLVLLREGGRGGSDPRLGNLLIVANCLSYAIYLVLARRLLARYPALVVLAWMFVLALVATPVLAMGHPLFPAATPRAWGGMAALVALPTIVGYLMNSWALARVSASTTAVFIYLQPLVAGASGAWLLGERPSAWTALAAVLLFAGIAMVLSRRATAASGSSRA